MPDILAEAWSTPGLGWLTLIIFVSGLVRGFAGFGTALIFVPLAAMFLPPVGVLIALMVIDLIGPLPLLPRAWRDGNKRDIGVMVVAMAIMVPIGTLLLERIDPQIFRWIAALIALGMVLLLLSGWRHNAQLGKPALAAIGGIGGFLGGFTGMPGPPVILTYMSGQYAPQVIRGNTILYLWAFDCVLATVFLARDMIEPTAVAIAAILTLPYLVGAVIGAQIFDPAHARLYRGIAYVIIAASALLALPIFE